MVWTRGTVIIRPISSAQLVVPSFSFEQVLFFTFYPQGTLSEIFLSVKDYEKTLLSLTQLVKNYRIGDRFRLL